MKRVIIHAVLALVLMIVQANVHSAFGIQLTCHYGVIAAVLSGVFTLPLTSSALSLLILATICDLFASGPLGLFAFACMLVFAVSRAFMHRFRTERFVFVMLWGCIMSIVLDAVLGILYSAYYRNAQFLTIFVQIFWKNALITGLMTPVVMWISQQLDRLFTPRRNNGFL